MRHQTRRSPVRQPIRSARPDHSARGYWQYLKGQDMPRFHREKAPMLGRLMMLVGGGLCFAALVLTVRESNSVTRGEIIFERDSAQRLSRGLDCTAVNCPWDDAARRISNRIEDIARSDITLPGFHPPKPPFEEFDPFFDPPWIGG